MNPILIAIIAVVVLILGFQYLVLRAAKKHQGEQVPQLEGSMAERITAYDKVVLYFTSASCGVCKPVTPIVEQFEQEGKSIIKIDIGEHMAVARAYHIKATPTWVVVENGVLSEIYLGARNKKGIEALLS